MSRKKHAPVEQTPAKVIHVRFGPGGGKMDGAKLDQPSAKTISPLTDLENRSLPGEPVSEMYTATEVSKLLGISTGKLRSLQRTGVVEPSGRRRGKPAYTFSDLIALRAARDLFTQRVRLKDVHRAVTNIRTLLPKVTRPLAELRIISDGQRVVVKSASGNFEPITGQMLLNFEVRQIRDDVVRVLRPTIGKERAKSAYDLYVQATRLDENLAKLDQAEELYRQALKLDPWLSIAYTNLGNICFRRGQENEAEVLYKKALEVDRNQPEAQYNLGYLMLEHGKLDDAIAFFLGAIQTDPQFSDAYFNLAMAYEQANESTKARPCWEKYLDLEPTGTWSDIARKHL